MRICKRYARVSFIVTNSQNPPVASSSNGLRNGRYLPLSSVTEWCIIYIIITHTPSLNGHSYKTVIVAYEAVEPIMVLRD